MRLIDADALMDKLGISTECGACVYNRTPFCGWKENYASICENIAEAPTIEPQTSEELTERLCALPQMQDAEGQDYVQLYDVLETLRRYAVNPRKTGRWEMKPDPYGFFEEIPVCSECGCTTKMRDKPKFCPNCGSYNGGEQHE